MLIGGIVPHVYTWGYSSVAALRLGFYGVRRAKLRFSNYLGSTAALSIDDAIS
jgi:hypothetical protein